MKKIIISLIILISFICLSSCVNRENDVTYNTIEDLKADYLKRFVQNFNNKELYYLGYYSGGFVLCVCSEDLDFKITVIENSLNYLEGCWLYYLKNNRVAHISYRNINRHLTSEEIIELDKKIGSFSENNHKVDRDFVEDCEGPYVMSDKYYTNKYWSVDDLKNKFVNVCEDYFGYGRSNYKYHCVIGKYGGGYLFEIAHPFFGLEVQNIDGVIVKCEDRPEWIYFKDGKVFQSAQLKYFYDLGILTKEDLIDINKKHEESYEKYGVYYVIEDYYE